MPRDDAGFLDLYGRGLQLHVENLDEVICRTDGVGPSFIKEMLRQAVLRVPPDDGPVVVTDAELKAVLDVLLDPTNPLTRLLLGATPAAPTTQTADGRPGHTLNRPGIRGGSIPCRKDGSHWRDRGCTPMNFGSGRGARAGTPQCLAATRGVCPISRTTTGAAGGTTTKAIRVDPWRRCSSCRRRPVTGSSCGTRSSFLLRDPVVVE